MSAAYLWLKALHVIAVAVWLGASITMYVIVAQIAGMKERRDRFVLSALCESVSRRVVAPSAGLTLLLGIITVVIGKAHMTFWLWWGVAAALLLLAAGGTLFRINFQRLSRLLEQPSGSDAEVNQVLARLRMLATVGITLIVATIVVMVLKPTL